MYASNLLNLQNPEEIFKEYEYLDASNYTFNAGSLAIINSYDLKTLFKFFDMFKDINQYEHGTYTMGMNCLCIARGYGSHAIVFKIIDYLVNRGMLLCDICNVPTVKSPIIMYIVTHYYIICGIKKLVNNDEIVTTNIDNNLINCIQIIILISKTRIIPKFVVTHKILYYYLSLSMSEIQ